MPNSMNQIIIQFGCRNHKTSTYPKKELSLPKFLNLKQNNLSDFEYKIQQILQKIYIENSENQLYTHFPKRNTPLTIDLNTPVTQKGWVAVFSPLKNKITISEAPIDVINLLHELKHAEQQFNDSKMNHYQKHQAYALLEASAKVFQCNYLKRGAYYNLSIDQALIKWIQDHYYPLYKRHYDQQWPLRKGSKTLQKIPRSLGIKDTAIQRKLLTILCKYISD